MNDKTWHEEILDANAAVRRAIAILIGLKQDDANFSISVEVRRLANALATLEGN